MVVGVGQAVQSKHGTWNGGDPMSIVHTIELHCPKNVAQSPMTSLVASIALGVVGGGVYWRDVELLEEFLPYSTNKFPTSVG